ncbi:class A beta-lactamase-related serine hydrolase [Altericroceibacterium spongiae]|uniref:Class A beta-lactamase-related serine hydrolase n=1 Tax=Altericroceibacterium spongiae TaxID=2320269 RepID=A0A420EK47_9SPHN|nr:serine hydrolase domain-containing protein [Altericroceibacterium spongiae]RKF21020.1 class A beta-lactamase-related serine hydrolase [Altericroceibacterium spongiae]
MSAKSMFDRRTLLRSGAIAGALASLAPGHSLFARTPEKWQHVQDFMTRYVEPKKLADMVAVLGWGQDAPQIFAQGTDSLRSQRRSDQDSLYRIYSMTKPVTGMAAMMLIDAGLMEIDQPISDFLPKFRDMQVQKVYDGPITPDNLEPAERPITIRHLLTHTAGLGYNFVQQGPLAQAYMRNGLIPGEVTKLDVPQIFGGEPVNSLAEFADRLAEMPLVYQPGTRWSYSVGLDLMGRIIEVVSGEAFDAFLQKRIFDPCGMTSTAFMVAPDDLYRLTTNYGILGGVLLPIDTPDNSVYSDKPPFPFGGAGLVSSPRDYDRFLQMIGGQGQIEGQRVMSPAAVRLGTSDLLPDTLAPTDSFAQNYGFGAGGRVGKGAQAGIYGWMGAAGTIGFVDMKRGLRHSLYTQYMPVETYPVQEEFPQAVAADLVATQN